MTRLGPVEKCIVKCDCGCEALTEAPMTGMWNCFTETLVGNGGCGLEITPARAVRLILWLLSKLKPSKPSLLSMVVLGDGRRLDCDDAPYTWQRGALISTAVWRFMEPTAQEPARNDQSEPPKPNP